MELDKTQLINLLDEILATEYGSVEFEKLAVWFNDKDNWEKAEKLVNEEFDKPNTAEGDFTLTQKWFAMRELVPSPFTPNTDEALNTINEIFDQIYEIGEIEDPKERDKKMDEMWKSFGVEE